MNNILITSAGKRVVLVQKFKETLEQFFPESKIFTTDMNPEMAPACHVSDSSFKVPRVTDESYISILLDICIKNEVSIVVPTIDTELLILSNHKSLFFQNGIHLMVSDSPFISVCRDKRKTGSFLAGYDIIVPKEIDKYHPIFPMFAKPYDGSLSANLHIIKTQRDLTNELLTDPKLIFMEYIDKSEFKEFTVDMYYGKDNFVKSIVPRERIEIRAGEINKGITRKNYIVDFLRTRLNYLPGVIGCICLQLFFRESDKKIYAIEINPRFGGGYPLSYYAKANFCENIIREYISCESLQYNDNWLNNTIMLRYDSEVILYE